MANFEIVIQDVNFMKCAGTVQTVLRQIICSCVALFRPTLIVESGFFKHF